MPEDLRALRNRVKFWHSGNVALRFGVVLWTGITIVLAFGSALVDASPRSPMSLMVIVASVLLIVSWYVAFVWAERKLAKAWHDHLERFAQANDDADHVLEDAANVEGTFLVWDHDLVDLATLRGRIDAGLVRHLFWDDKLRAFVEPIINPKSAMQRRALLYVVSTDASAHTEAEVALVTALYERIGDPKPPRKSHIYTPVPRPYQVAIGPVA